MVNIMQPKLVNKNAMKTDCLKVLQEVKVLAVLEQPKIVGVTLFS